MSAELLQGWVAYTDEDATDATSLSRTQREAIDEWESDLLDGWRDHCPTCDELLQDDCPHFPEELRVGLAVTPDPLVEKGGKPTYLIGLAVGRLLEDLAEIAEAPEGCGEGWPPGDPGPHLDQLHQEILVALQGYLERTTGRRTATWWVIEREEIWKRGSDGGWRPPS